MNLPPVGSPQSMPLATPPPPAGPMPNMMPLPDAPSEPPFDIQMQEDGSALWRMKGPNGELGPVVKVAPGPKGGAGAPVTPGAPPIMPTPGPMR